MSSKNIFEKCQPKMSLDSIIVHCCQRVSTKRDNKNVHCQTAIKTLLF